MQVRNIGYPDWIADDEQLVHYLANFPVSPAESANVNLIEMIDGIARWMQTKAFEPLAWTGHTNRSDFGAVPNIVRSFAVLLFCHLFCESLLFFCAGECLVSANVQFHHFPVGHSRATILPPVCTDRIELRDVGRNCWP